MDFSKFSNDNFDVKDWVNGVFRAQQNEKQHEAYTATLITKLQRYIQEVNRSLEDISQQAVSNLPRVLRDVETLKQEATFLWQQMQQVKDEIKSVEQRTSHSMQVLVKIDNVRSKVEQASEALKEADNWSSLASAMEDIFKSGDVEAIAAQLESMRASLQVLKNSPDYDDKVVHLEALKNRLETSVSPSVVSAFMQHNTEDAKRFCAIFASLERKNELKNYYLKCHRGRISSKWLEIVSDSNDANRGADQSDVALLSEFYELLLSTWHTEMKWCSNIFGRHDSLAIVAQLLLEVTLSVESGPAVLIGNAIQGLASEKLLIFSQLHGTTNSFTQNLKRAIVEQERIESSMLAKLADAFWHPYMQFFLQYQDMETETLLALLSDIQLDARDIIDLSQLLDLSVKKLFDHAQIAFERCGKLTGMFGACDVIDALEKYFCEYCDRFARQLRTIASSCGIKKSVVAEVHESCEDDEDWTVFQHCVRIISTCGQLLVRFSDFQHLFSSSLLSRNFKATVDGPSAMSPWETYNYMKYGDPARYRKLIELVSADEDVSSASTLSLFVETKRRFEELNQQAHNLTFDVAFAHVRRQISSLPIVSEMTEENDAVVSQSEMPMFSVSPSERATHIGQYLMTLPQHLEPFASIEGDESSRNRGLEVALHTGRLPFPPKPREGGAEDIEVEHMSDQWLGAIVRATEHTYIEAVTQIESLNSQMARQLVADLDYMGNVIDSLGLAISKELEQLRELLNVPSSSKEEFRNVAAQAPSRMANIIANMRKMSL